jgi:hypothetical protein
MYAAQFFLLLTVLTWVGAVTEIHTFGCASLWA